MMTAQYSAAALASENKILAHPASVDSIPTSADFEDFVSMGPAAALKLARIAENLRLLVAIELLCAAQAAETRGVANLSRANVGTHEVIRKLVPELDKDRELSNDIEKLARCVRNGGFSVANVP
jgi:histidine ammonia-lyase